MMQSRIFSSLYKSRAASLALRMTTTPVCLLRAPMMFQQIPMRQFAYHQNVIDHYENPRNVGSFDKKAQDVGTGLVGAPACGDVMKL